MSILVGRPLDHAKPAFNARQQLMPPFMGLLISLLVYVGMNVPLLAARWHYMTFKTPSISFNIGPSNNATPAINTVAPSEQPQIIIPKINVTAPVIYNEPSIAEGPVQLALRRGVLHYGTTTEPGKAGNPVFFGHSSGYPWAPGDYKFIFTNLDKLDIGDEIIVDYAGVRYTYKVSAKKVVDPDDSSILNQGTKHQISVVTCTPVGTSKNRLVVTADQVAPTVQD